MARTRREFLAGSVGACMLGLARGRSVSTGALPLDGMGIVIHSYAIRSALEKERFAGARSFLEHCHGLGAGGVQVAIGALAHDEAVALGERAAELGMYL